MSRITDGACALYYNFTVRDKYGCLLKRQKSKLAHSFLSAYIKNLYLRMVSSIEQSIVDVTNTSRTIAMYSDMATDAAAADDTFGLVVGTGTNAENLADYALQTKIAHGTSAGQLQYSASVVNAPSSTSTTTSLICTRDFTNATASTITVNEIGIYANFNDGLFGTTRIMCIVRDLQTISLIAGAILTLHYEFQTTA